MLLTHRLPFTPSLTRQVLLGVLGGFFGGVLGRFLGVLGGGSWEGSWEGSWGHKLFLAETGLSLMVVLRFSAKWFRISGAKKKVANIARSLGKSHPKP